MNPELGHFALIMALCLALVQTVVPMLGSYRRRWQWMAVARPAAYGQAFFVVLAFVSLATSFVQNDFSVLYVAANSNSALPLVYRISAVWGAHEGSLLLWTLMLSLWTVAVARFSRSLPHVLVARVIAVMGFISVGFLLFMLLTSNPFARLFPAALDGRDLNPLLQDPGLAIHPPMLYMGYVGFSVAFSFAIAALLGGSLDATWARWSRPWTTVAWSFLTLGIALGSWWAYYELGWGGWWFWDPVENASFMPWLVGTALIHSLAVSEKRGAFKAWTVLLAIFAFSLSLLGTFLVRSGVLVSVHAFATDPERGVFILAFLAVVIGGSLSLYAWRGPATRGGGDFRLVSRESMLLVMNILLVNAAFTVLLGTLFPLIMDALQAGKISVGPPYFQMVFVPLMLPVLVLVGFLPHVRWKSSDPREAFQRMWLLMVISVVLAGALLWIAVGKTTFMVLLGVSLALWVMLSTLKGVWLRVADKPGRLQALLALPRGFYGMSLAHFGVGVFVIGVTLTSSYSIEQDIRMATGEEVTVAGYQFRFEGVERVAGANYAAERGKLGVMRDGNLLTTLQPEKRIYKVQQSGMTEAAIDAGLFRDLYVAMGEPLGQDAWSIRIQYKPFVRWIWLGCLFMFAGGLVAISDRRYRLLARRQGSVPANAMAAESGS